METVGEQNPARQEKQNPPGASAHASRSIDKVSGPRTPAGKERSRRNAETHGIFSDVELLECESRGDFERHRAGLWESFQPVGLQEKTLVDKLAVYDFRLRRLFRAEVEEIQTGVDFFGGSMAPHPSVLNHPDRLLRYEVTIMRGYDRTLSQLQRIQALRRGEAVLPEIEVHHSVE